LASLKRDGWGRVLENTSTEGGVSVDMAIIGSDPDFIANTGKMVEIYYNVFSTLD